MTTVCYTGCTGISWCVVPSVTGCVHDAAQISFNGHPLKIFEKYAFLSCFLTDCYSKIQMNMQNNVIKMQYLMRSTTVIRVSGSRRNGRDRMICWFSMSFSVPPRRNRRVVTLSYVAISM